MELGIAAVAADGGMHKTGIVFRHRPHGRQVVDARGDHRPYQRDARRAHPHHRGPDRVPAHAQEGHRQSARAVQSITDVRARAARGAASGRRKSSRLVARCALGDDRDQADPAAETDIWVLDKLHTIDASKTAERIVGTFEVGDRQSRCARLRRRSAASSRADPAGRAADGSAVVEVPKSTGARRRYLARARKVRVGKSLLDAMRDGAMDGMQHFGRLRAGARERSSRPRCWNATNAEICGWRRPDFRDGKEGASRVAPNSRSWRRRRSRVAHHHPGRASISSRALQGNARLTVRFNERTTFSPVLARPHRRTHGHSTASRASLATQAETSTFSDRAATITPSLTLAVIAHATLPAIAPHAASGPSSSFSPAISRHREGLPDSPVLACRPIIGWEAGIATSR